MDLINLRIIKNQEIFNYIFNSIDIKEDDYINLLKCAINHKKNIKIYELLKFKGLNYCPETHDQIVGFG